MLRIEIHSGAVTFSGSVFVTDCALVSTQLVGTLASASLSVFGASLTDSTVSLSGGSAVLDSSCTLVNSPASITCHITAGTLSVSQCELQTIATRRDISAIYHQTRLPFVQYNVITSCTPGHSTMPSSKTTRL